MSLNAASRALGRADERRFGVVVALGAISMLLNNLHTPLMNNFSKQAHLTRRNYYHERLIHDVTLPWNDSMYRPWLDMDDDDDKNLPSTMILMTNFGWNQPNQTEGRTFARTMRERELYTGLVNHPLFHPTGWEDIENNILPIRNNTNYYVFLDRMSCKESNYPIYGGGQEGNRDRIFNRSPDIAAMLWKGYMECSHPNDLNLKSTRLLKAAKDKKSSHLNINATVILFECSGWGNCKGRRNADIPTSIAFLSSMLQHIDEDIDQGLIPPPGKRTTLTMEEEESIRSCRAETERDFNVVYTGNFRSGLNSEFHEFHGGARYSYLEHHNPSKKIIIQENHSPKPVITLPNGTNYTLSYTDVLRDTKIALAPRGDNKFR